MTMTPPPDRFKPAHLAAAACLSMLASMHGTAGAQGRTDTVAITGQIANGAGAGTFSRFEAPLLNDAGQTAFKAFITGGSSTNGIYHSGSALTAIALQGQSASEAGAGTLSGFLGLVLNNAGQTAFLASITGDTRTLGVYRSSSGSELSPIALLGQSATGAGAGTFSDFGFLPVLNDVGQTAFFARIAGGSSTQGIYRSSSGSALSAIALQGQSAQGAFLGTFSGFSEPVLNDAGQTAFFASIAGGFSSSGIYRSSSDGGPFTAIAKEGQSATGAGAGTFAGFLCPVLNEAGQTAFAATITGGTSLRGIYRSSSDASTLTPISLQGQSATGASAGTFQGFLSPVLNDVGQTAFIASITGGTSTQGVYRSSNDGNALTVIALQGQSAAGAGAGTFSSLSNLVLNETGQAAFAANIIGGTSSRGLYLGDGRDTVAAQLQGAALAGKTVSSLIMSAGSLNRHGQLAYRATFTDGTEGNFVYTPALRWRETFSGSWDNAEHWTLGIAPASVHDVSIDPAVALTVTGPAGNASVRSLTVGSGGGAAALNMVGGTLSASQGVQVANQGAITGVGTLQTAGTLRNAGTIAAGGVGAVGQLSIEGNVEQTAAGRIAVDIGGATADVLAISGTATLGGTLDIRTLPGSTLSRGASYKVMTWGDRTTDSQFSSISFAQASNARFAAAYGTDGLTLQVIGYNFNWAGPAAGGLWNVDQHWSGGDGGKPQAGDAVFLGNANTRIDRPQSIAEITGTGKLSLLATANLTLSDRATLGGLALSQQAIFRNNGLVEVNGPSSWEGGTLTGSGKTRFAGELTMAGFSGLRGGHTLELNGASSLINGNGSGEFYVSEGARIVNNGQWTVQLIGSSRRFSNGFGGTPGTFDNVGTFTVASPDANAQFAISSITFNNTGVLNVNAGFLDIQAAFNSTAGQINIASGGVLRLSSGAANIKGTINNAGVLRIEGRGTLTTAGELVVQGGQTILNDSTINNTNVLRITSAFDWKQGTFAGAGTTRLEGNTTLSQGTHAIRNGHTIEFAGNTTHTVGIVSTGSASRLVNTGSWADQGAGDLELSNGGGGASSRFDNQGTYTKTTNTVTSFGGGLELNNTGTVRIDAGTLRISSNFNNQGQLNVVAGAELSGQAAAFGNAGTLTGDGTIRAAASLTNTGTVAAGGLDDAGQLAVIGSFIQLASGRFLVDLADAASGGFDVLSITGNATLGGTLAINLLDGAQFKVGDSFTVMTWRQRLGNSQFAGFDLSRAGGYEFAADYGVNGLSLRVTTAVPEPMSVLLAGAGLLVVAGLRRKAAPRA